MAFSSLKAMTETRDLKVGHYVGEFATPGIGKILAAAGCDFVFLDMEHSGFSFDTIRSTLRYLEAAGLPAMVRPPSREYDHIARLCDVGAAGLAMPMVGSGEAAARIVDSMKYHPDGHRGIALQIAHDDYRPGGVKEKLAAANEKTTLVTLVETAEGARNADAIAATPGVDALWIGHLDLSASLGIPGEFGHPDFVAATEAIKAACRKHGKSLGRLVGSVDEGVRMYDEGYDMICYGGDIWLLYQAVSEGVAGLRERCGR